MKETTGNVRIARNALFLYGRMLFVLFVSIYTTRVVMNALGVVDYGVYNVVCGFVAMFSFLNTTLSNGIQRFYNYELGRSNGSVSDVYCSALFLQVLLALIILIILEPLGLWYVNCKMIIPPERLYAANWIFQLSTVSLVLIVLQIPYSAAVLAYERMDYFALVSVLDAVLKLIIVLLLPHLKGDHLIIYGFLQLIVASINLLLFLVYAKVKFKALKFQLSKSFSMFKSISSFSGWNILSTFSWMTQNQGINMVMNLFFGPVINAARGVSGQIQSAIQGFCENLVIAFRPQLVQSYAQNNIERTRKMMYSMSKVMFVFFFMLSLPVIIEIKQILRIWLGDNIPDYTTSFTVLVLISMFPRNFVLAFAQVVHATGNIKSFQIATAIIVLLMLPLSYFALYLGLSPNSVYWLNILICVILLVVCLLLLKKVFPINLWDYVKRIILPCFLMAVFTPVVPLLISYQLQENIVRLIFVICASLIICAIWSLFFIFDNSERHLLMQFIPFRKKTTA